MKYDIYNADCLEQMKSIPDGSVDMVLCDLPYECLATNNPDAQWDRMIPFEPLWAHYLRVCKRNAAIVLFAQGMFTARLMMSKPDLWRYNLIWDKMRVSGFLNAKRMPLRSHEDICVFYRELPTYNVQLEDLKEGQEDNHARGTGKHKDTNRAYGNFANTDGGCSGVKGKKFPRSILSFQRPFPTEKGHPTEKSVELCEWLIRTYTNEGETVLDNTMGSGTTGVACVRTDRNFIGIEKDAHWFGTAELRLRRAKETGVQQSFDLFGDEGGKDPAEEILQDPLASANDL